MVPNTTIKIGHRKVYCRSLDYFMILLFLIGAKYKDTLSRNLVKGLIIKGNSVIGKFHRILRGPRKGMFEVWLSREYLLYLRRILPFIVIEKYDMILINNKRYINAYKISSGDTVYGYVAWSPDSGYVFLRKRNVALENTQTLL